METLYKMNLDARHINLIAGIVMFAAIAGFDSTQQASKVTYWNDIEPVVRKKCLACHTRDGHGPFSLTTYEEVRKRAGLIRSVAILHTMPPTDASSDFGQISLQDSLTDEETLNIQKWWMGGSPQGQRPATHPLQNPRDNHEFSESLQVFQGVTAKSEGRPYWLTSAIPVPKDMQINSFRFVPSSPKAIRHVLLMRVSQSAAKSFLEQPIETLGMPLPDASGIIGAWSPGNPDWKLPKGVAVSVQKGDCFLIQLQIHPTGKTENLQSKLEFVLDPRSTKPPQWKTLEQRTFVIPAEERKMLSDEVIMSKPFQVISVIPEARFFATQIRVSVSQASKAQQTLMFIQSWNPFWIGSYLIPDSARFAADSTLKAEVSYDNGKHSGTNENRLIQDVHSGPSLDDELFRIHVQYVD